MWESAKASQMERESDAAVVEAVRHGDREAFRALVQKYQDLLFRTAVARVGSGDTAADLVQATFIKAYTNIWRCRDPERFGAWIYRILINGTKDHLKSKRQRDLSLDDEGGPVLQLRSKHDPERDLERSQTRDRLNAALAGLPELMREAFLLKHIEGRSYDEIAEMLGASVPAMKMRVHRARALLLETMTMED